MRAAAHEDAVHAAPVVRMGNSTTDVLRHLHRSTGMPAPTFIAQSPQRAVSKPTNVLRLPDAILT